MRTGVVRIVDITQSLGLRLDAGYHICPTRNIDAQIRAVKARMARDAKLLERRLAERKKIVEDAKARGLDAPDCP